MMFTAWLAALTLAQPAVGDRPEMVEVTALTDRIVMLHLDEGFVRHHGLGQARTDAEVFIAPLDLEIAQATETFRISSPSDPNYITAVAPVTVHRKTKGTDFAWFVDDWIDGRAVNRRPDRTHEHWLYLVLPEPLIESEGYTITAPGLAEGADSWTFTFGSAWSRSEAIHVNQVGYVPDAPEKFAYVYHWMGDGGSMPLDDAESRRCWLVDLSTDDTVFESQLQFRAPADQVETFHVSDSPKGNFHNADVWECDFSDFRTPGRYEVSVEGVGHSFPFAIDRDVYFELYYHVARQLYHQRSGIALVEPFTEFTRPAPHHPRETPSFIGHLKYSTLRNIDYGSESSTREALEPTIVGELDAWGWYQDAGDWDGYPSHARVPFELLTAYMITPWNFQDNELNIPESGNGVPDILDEAAWLPRFGHRLRHELMDKGWGTGGVGLRVHGDPWTGSVDGVPSYLDATYPWVVSGEDPNCTFRYAAMTAQLAIAFRLAGVEDPEGVDWAQEAIEAYAWAKENQEPGDTDFLTISYPWAAAALFRLTGEASYEADFREAITPILDQSDAPYDQFWAPTVYLLAGDRSESDAELYDRVRALAIRTADAMGIETPSRRAMRWGGLWSMPMLVGHQTTPMAIEVAVGYALVRDRDPERARQYKGTLYNTADYFLGTNPLNIVWMTGVGTRSVQQMFDLDGWYNGKDRFPPGMIPYGPWRKEQNTGQGPWDLGWAYSTVHPAIDQWPGAERWFENRNTVLNGEFTVHQQTGPAAAFYGILRGLQPPD